MDAQKVIIDTTAEDEKKKPFDWQALFSNKVFWMVLGIFVIGVFVAIYIVPILIGLAIGVLVYFWFTRVILKK